MTRLLGVIVFVLSFTGLSFAQDLLQPFQRDAYGPGIGQDQYGRPVRPRPGTGRIFSD